MGDSDLKLFDTNAAPGNESIVLGRAWHKLAVHCKSTGHTDHLARDIAGFVAG